ncbi:gp53-like domain-containing protein [Pseudomonas sp. BJa3]|uniref:gp53-like domain-containing protein n=1 Tax=Pseudomonas sp. BJa3 TaxID=2986525 RepID=UPI002265A31C|nr:phage tail protein [Pseudomonas sp. BJa3]MCX5508394.1 hypothetical protein [Pseudomonas sp. BJa3]
MDYPKRIPNVGLIGGKFADENPSTGQPGSLIPAAWGNAVTDELLAVIKAAGFTPSEDDTSQLLQAIQGLAAGDVKRAVRVTTTGPIALSGLQTIDGVALLAGDRVLVKDQANAAQNWIYTASANAWSRALDANENAECTPGHLIIVQSGASYAGSLWQLTNTTPPQIGATALTFAMLLGKTGVAAGSYNQVSVDALGRVIGGSNPTTLAGHGITDGLKKGYLGLGGNIAPAGPIDTIGLDGGFYSFTDGQTTFGNYASVLNIPYITDDYAAQIGFMYSGDEPIIAARSAKTSGQWGKTRILWHSGNFDPAGYYTRPQVDGLLSKKANWAITLGGYGITDAYTKGEVDTALAARLTVGSVSRQQPVLASPAWGAEYGSGALIIREAMEVGASDQREVCAPGIGFHWLGMVAGKLVMDSIGKLKWNGQPLLAGAIASQAEVDSGSTDTNVVTPFKLRWGFSFIKGGGGANNAIVFPTWLGGLKIQWGVHIANAADAETTVTFPLSFSIIPACISGFTHDGAMTQSTVVPQARLLTETGFQSRREDVINSSSFSGTAYIRWIAIGY